MQLTKFKVTHYRNIVDSGWVDVSKVTAFVGQNEAGKSNLFEALCRINSFVASDLPVDGSDMMTKRVEAVLQMRYGRESLDRRLVMREILRRFDTWKTLADLPSGVAGRAERLFSKINDVFA